MDTKLISAALKNNFYDIDFQMKYILMAPFGKEEKRKVNIVQMCW